MRSCPVFTLNSQTLSVYAQAGRCCLHVLHRSRCMHQRRDVQYRRATDAPLTLRAACGSTGPRPRAAGARACFADVAAGESLCDTGLEPGSPRDSCDGFLVAAKRWERPGHPALVRIDACQWRRPACSVARLAASPSATAVRTPGRGLNQARPAGPSGGEPPCKLRLVRRVGGEHADDLVRYTGTPWTAAGSLAVIWQVPGAS